MIPAKLFALPAYPQVKSPPPDNTWIAIQLSANPLGGSLGAYAGMSGTMVVDGQLVHVHCGGWDAFNHDGTSSDCFALRVDSSGEVLVDSLAPLPQARKWACYSSDGGRLAVAGGWDDSGGINLDA